MKRTLILAVSAAVLSVSVSCQKEESSVNGSDGGLLFSAVIGNPVTKTVVNTDVNDLTSRGKVSWELTDTVTIIASSGQTAVYKVQSIDDKGVAIFEKKSGDNLPTSGVFYLATYGKPIASAQTYAGEVKNLPMTAYSGTTTLSFNVACGLLRVNLKDESNIKSIEVSGKLTNGTSVSDTLICVTPVSVTDATDFFIALDGGTYDKFTFTDMDGKVCTKLNSEGGIVVTNNTIVTIKFSDLPEFK